MPRKLCMKSRLAQAELNTAVGIFKFGNHLYNEFLRFIV